MLLRSGIPTGTPDNMRVIFNSEWVRPPRTMAFDDGIVAQFYTRQAKTLVMANMLWGTATRGRIEDVRRGDIFIMMSPGVAKYIGDVRAVQLFFNGSAAGHDLPEIAKSFCEDARGVMERGRSAHQDCTCIIAAVTPKP